MTTTSSELRYLFPVPSLPPSRLSPGHSPGVSPESTDALQEVLKDNHTRWHIFFNEMRYHNHAPHRSLAAWALGADADTIRRGYKRDCSYEKPAFKSPGPITWENFNDHLGDDRYFAAYMQFFIAFVKERGIPAALERFIFSSQSNIGSTAGITRDKQPNMLNRFLAGLIHPLIHTGYGAEFGLPGMVVEGLAEAASLFEYPGFLEPLHLFDGESLAEEMSNINIAAAAGSALSRAADVVGSTVNSVLPQPLVGIALGPDSTQRELRTTSKDPDPHALTILARVLRDPRFKPAPAGAGWKEPTFEDVLKGHGEQIAAYVREWKVDVKNMEELSLWEQKVEELVWTVTVLYGVAGWVDGRDKQNGFNSDFFLMHHVTSSIFIPSLCALISAQSRVRLLKAYFHAICVWAIARGQPLIDIKAFMKATKNPQKSIPSATNATQTTLNGNAWDRLLEAARIHVDEHLTKTIRSLAAWGSAFGTRRARIPLPGSVRQENVAPKGLAIDPGNANITALKRGNPEGEGTGEDPDLSPRAWREWKNGTSASPPSPTTMRGVMPLVQNASPKTPTHRKKPSEDADLSPRAWREAVNHGLIDVHGHERIPEMEIEEALTSSRNSDNYLPKTEMPGSEYLDGTLFLRVAVLAMQRAGWDIEKGAIERPSGKMTRPDEEWWDFAGFFDQRSIEKSKA